MKQGVAWDMSLPTAAKDVHMRAVYFLYLLNKLNVLN